MKNWRNFLALHQLTQRKPTAERQAIQNIIGQADFSDSKAFQSALVTISKNASISEQTKLEISQQFDGADIFTVRQMDRQLKRVKTYRKKIEKQITTKSKFKESIDGKIDRLKAQLENLSLDDPKRTKLEAQLKEQKAALQRTKTEIQQLQAKKSPEIAFPLRNGFIAQLNADGSRSVKISAENFTVRIPHNILPFSGGKDLRIINIAFSYLALRTQDIADEIFKPALLNNAIPNKDQRDTGHLILSTLGIADTQIVSELQIKQVQTDLARLTDSEYGKSGREYLIDLGIYDGIEETLNMEQFTTALTFIRQNRQLRSEEFYSALKEFLTTNEKK